MLRGHSFYGSVSVTSPRRPGRKLVKGVSEILSRGQPVAFDYIEDMLLIKPAKTDILKLWMKFSGKLVIGDWYSIWQKKILMDHFSSNVLMEFY